MTAPKSVAMGQVFDFELTVANFGPSTARSVTVTNPLPEGVEFVSVSSSDRSDKCALSESGKPEPEPLAPEPGPDGEIPPPYTYREVLCDIGALTAGESSLIRLTVERTSPWEIYNYAYISAQGNFDENQENDYAQAQLAADPSVTSDISTRLQGPDRTPLVGETFALRARVRNDGPASTEDVWLSVPLTAELRFVSATSSDPADSCTYEAYPVKGPPPMMESAGPSSSGTAPPERDEAPGYAYPNYGWGGVNCNLGAVGGSEEALVTITVERAKARAIWGSAHAYGRNYDPNYENNYTELEIRPDESNPADVSLTKEAPPNPDVGTEFDYVLTVRNNGPQTATAVTLDDPVPAGVDLVSVTAADDSDMCSYDKDGSDHVYPAESRPYYVMRAVHCELGSLAPAQTATVRVTVTRTAEWEIWNSAWVSTASYDADYENDYASTYIKGERPWGYCPDDPPPPEPPPSPEVKNDDSIPGCDPDAAACGTTGADEIRIDFCPVVTGAGDDKIEATTGSGSAHGMLIDAGGGADTIDLAVQVPEGKGRVVRIRAGAGADLINITSAPGSGSVKVIVFSGDGDDRVYVDATAAARGLKVIVRGGDGNDSIETFDSTRSADPSYAGGVSLFGGRGDDSLMGGPGPDALSGAQGADLLDGGLGDDSLDGGRSSDTCRGGPGRDTQQRC